MTRRWFRIAAAFAPLLIPQPALARTTIHDLSIEAAMNSPTGQEKLLKLPVYFKGQSHKAVASELGEFTANRRTNAFNKSDEEACQIAFLSAVIALQTRAQAVGADAVIDVRSTTRHQNLESATQYRCAAGNVVANVVLVGRMVKLK
jgi:uncharacterized protein YbjQ (UPF0145 family)